MYKRRRRPMKRYTVESLQSQLKLAVCHIKVLRQTLPALFIDGDVQSGLAQEFLYVIRILDGVSREMVVFKEPLTDDEVQSFVEKHCRQTEKVAVSDGLPGVSERVEKAV